MKLLFVYPRFERHADSHPELRTFVPMNEYLGSPSLGIATMAAITPSDWELEFRDDRVCDAARPTDADLVALSFFTPAATRGLELADYFREAGHTVVAGGIFPTALPDVVQPHVSSVVVGEGESSWPQLLTDFAAGALRPRYTCTENVDLATLPPPNTRLYFDAELEGWRPDDYPLQLSRGCSLACHACILPRSMGNSLRAFPIHHVISQLHAMEAAGKRACLTEDTSWLPGAGRRILEALLDYLIDRGAGATVSYIGTSFPMIRTTPAPLLRKARAAGIDMYYLVTGFDPISMKAWTGEHPRALERATEAVQMAFDAGIEPYASFLYGNDQDNEGTVDRVLEFCDRTGIRKAEFAVATPYPGTPKWLQLEREDRILTRDWRRYNDANPTFYPLKLSPDQVVEGYLRLWREFYAPRRAAVSAMTDYDRIIQF
ncbi:MAG: cobalamin B12-binding domain-containing protein [Deltaproteobacteria bacterium]|nr:cobalamin B12-binding domain-containing protein [Deltaproteobacteria bacterium]